MGRDGKARRVVATGMTFALAGTLFCAPATPALAEESELEQLQEAAIEAADAYQVAQDKVDQVKADVSENQARIAELEDQLPEKREKASAAIKAQYKLAQEQSGLLALLLSSESFGDFVSRLYYLDAIAESNMDSIDELAQASSELDAAQAALESDLEEAEKQSQTAQYAYNQAQKAAETARKKAMEKAAEAQRAYEAQQAAGEQDPTVTEIEAATDTSTKDATTTDESTGATDDGTTSTANAGDVQSSADASSATDAQESQEQATTTSASDAQSIDTSAQEAPSSSATSNSTSTSTSTTSASYTYVLASMYGEGDGFMYGQTASGDFVTPTSMGVAMKTMPLGTIIEITYNGRTVTAVVNDRGPYVGNRQIDLQPAVAHALGFDGVGTVGYRIVG